MKRIEEEKLGEININIRLVYVTTVPDTIRAFLMGGHIDFMKSAGFEVICVSSPGKALDEAGRYNEVGVHGIKMTRGITPVSDLRGLVSLYFLFRRIKPEVVNLSTPKASLLGSVAAWAARVPVRIYMNRGTVFVNDRGVKRLVLKWVERLTSRLCHQTIFVSNSQMEFARREKTVSKKKGIVLRSGACELNAARFDPERGDIKEKAAVLREGLGLPGREKGALTVGYVGRLERDKGIIELSAAWGVLREKYPNIYLLLVGPWDTERVDNAVLEIKGRFERDGRVVPVGYVEDVAPYYLLMDVLIFPSHREGFPYAPMEAAAMRLPVVATDAIGCVDAVVSGETGFLVPRGDVGSLCDAVARLLDDPSLRRRLGGAGRERCVRDFSPEPIREALADEYKRLLKERSL
ncbi:MAG: glycosyltransferase family 4 protein [Deltaproteobacteria bacterium]|uniref:Glycosyltransferase family 4 protein n=1 Tax=Candidatus Zymogenus saltonus TaxID=2844893 RepID=A0A9D8KJM5_9DELT|nr:glycosyltransferase family 4 protein [Candidatus Zymogenus saltonus]